MVPVPATFPMAPPTRSALIWVAHLRRSNLSAPGAVDGDESAPAVRRGIYRCTTTVQHASSRLVERQGLHRLEWMSFLLSHPGSVIAAAGDHDSSEGMGVGKVQSRAMYPAGRPSARSL